MVGMSVDRAALGGLRGEIDAIDAQIVALLARRLQVVDRVIAVKQRDGIAAHLPERVEEVVAGMRRSASAHGLPPDLAEAVWRAMIDWIVLYEDETMRAQAGKDARTP
jgi:isochorismate pyruvate lyase